MNNFFNTTGFHWWMGVVEDRMDPLYLGRCRVRILGFHNKDKTILPIADLPWATPIQPITSAAVSGVGTAPVGPVEGTWIVGFFADGDDCQQPVMLGTFAGIPQSDYEQKIPSNHGFRDPNKKYPLPALLDEPDTNRLARNQGITETIVQKKKDARDEGIDIAFSGTWDQPKIPYGAKYPFNHVTYTESGHVIELDDTPSAERLHVYHKAGSFVEIDRAGSMVRRIVGNDYQIIDCNEYIHIRGKANVTVDGSCNIYVKNDCNLQVDGNLKAHAHGNIEMKAGKKMMLTAKENIEIKTAGDFNVDASKLINMKSLTGMNLTGTLKTTIASLITEVAILKMNAMSITPAPPIPPVIISPSVVSSKSPTEPTISDPAFALTAEDREKIKKEIVVIEKSSDVTAREFVALKQTELSTNEHVSVDAPEPLPPVVACEAAKKVVEAAKRDVLVTETQDSNYGGKPGGEITPVGLAGRIDEMLRISGNVNNIQKVQKTGVGDPWCAAAVSAWWKEAGLSIPPSGAAAAKVWATWGKSKGLYSTVPKIGAVALYGTEGTENHVGIVAAIDATGKVTTIEGNTSGKGFNRDGGGCFVKTPNPNTTHYPRAYVHVPENCVPPAPATIDSACMSAEMTAYVEKLKGTMPEKVRAQIPDVVCKFAINTPLRLAHFLAQCAHESVNFTAVREYASGKAYEGRADLGNTQPGDGPRYKGRGYIQLTGRVNYRAFSKFVPENCEENPELVADKYPMLSAAWYWTRPRLKSGASCLTCSDKGDNPETVLLVSKLVNGVNKVTKLPNGLADRQSKFNIFNSLA